MTRNENIARINRRIDRCEEVAANATLLIWKAENKNRPEQIARLEAIIKRAERRIDELLAERAAV